MSSVEPTPRTMSAKWIRSQEWDRQHLTGWLTPVRWVVRTLSLVRTAVILLIGVVLFGVAASVPIGLLALIPTYLVYALSLLVCLLLIAALPTWLVVRGLERVKVRQGVQFGAGFACVLGLGAAAVLPWLYGVWPVLRYDPVTGDGLRLFAGFVDRYKAVTVRRLPGMEMSELEFYAWWPLPTLLLLFVINLTVATARRIEFIFPNLGVLTVHTGIVTIAIGSAYYGSLKQEGDVLLLAGPPDPATGKPTPGPVETGFFDNTRVVLRVQQRDERWEQRPLIGLPRYHDYNLGVIGFPPGAHAPEDFGPLDIPASQPLGGGGPPAVDADVRLRVVGYSMYARLEPMWRALTAEESRRAATLPGYSPTPLRRLEVIASLSDEPNGREQAMPLELAPTVPAERIARLFQNMVNIEFTQAMSEHRWQELRQPMPASVRHGLVVQLPGQPAARLYGVEPGDPVTVGEGENAWTLTVKSVSPEPPFGIITPGFEGATSSVMVVRVEPPHGPGQQAAAFDRYIYHRFPELNQDLVQPTTPGGQPLRRPASGAISLAYIDASAVQVYLDEQPDAVGRMKVRALVRVPGRPPEEYPDVAEGSSVPIVPKVSVRLVSRLPEARQVYVPVPTPDAERDKAAIGNHKQAAVAVEVSLAGAAGGWSQTLWVPFSQYRSERDDGIAEGVPVRLPDGRRISVVFGRLWHPLPGIALRLRDFEMFPYPHSTQPRDFRSELDVFRGVQGSVVEQAATSLNEPLKVSSFVWTADRAWIANAVGSFLAMLGPGQYKFSQAGWDANFWQKTRAEADAGKRQRPYARFTILGVGNNPGIYVIATGAVLMIVGIPWAFYVKPWLVRRRKAAIQRQLAAQGLTQKPRGQVELVSRNGSGGHVPAAGQSVKE